VEEFEERMVEIKIRNINWLGLGWLHIGEDS
jgi:hypothetical protein